MPYFYLCTMDFSSKLLEKGVEALAGLPGIGKKTALRLALHLINEAPEKVSQFTTDIEQMRQKIQKCKICFNISDSSTCTICSDNRRQKNLVCVVEGIRDVLAIESTGQFKGLYHILEGVISPIDGIGPSDLTIEALVDRIQHTGINEIIMAISPTIEGDTTMFYISKKLNNLNVKVTSIARGVSFGGELQYADELTLGRSIASRTLYK